MDCELGLQGLRVWAAVPAQEWRGARGGGPTLRWVRGQNGPRSRCPARSSLLRRPRRALARHPVPLVPSAGGPPTCRLSAHGCGGGGGSSGLRKTCWPRLRNWTTAMRMWCSTRTMLAAARPPAGPAAALGQRVRDSSAGSARGSAPAPPRPAHSPPPDRAAPPTLPPPRAAPLCSSDLRTPRPPAPGSHLPSLSALKTLPACPLLGSPTR